MLNKTRRWTQQERAKVEHCLLVEREAMEKRSERERLRTRVKLYVAQLKEMEEPEKEGKRPNFVLRPSLLHLSCVA